MVVMTIMKKQIQPVIVLLVILLLLVQFAVNLYALKALYGDGAYRLFDLLAQRELITFDKPRIFALLAPQIPVYLAVLSGVKDLNILIYTWNFGVYAFPTFFWLVAFFVQKKTFYFWIILLGYSVTFLTCGFFIMGEFNLSYATAACAFSLLTKTDIRIHHLALLVMSSLILALSYESTVFLGPLLFIMAAYQIRTQNLKDRTHYKVLLAISASNFAGGTVVSALSILRPRDPANLESALNLTELIAGKHFFLLALALAVFALFLRRYTKSRLIAFFIILTLSLFSIFNWDELATDVMTYRWRALSGVLLFLVLTHGFLHFIRSQKDSDSGTMLSFPSISSSLTLFLILLTLNFTESVKYVSWLKIFESISIQSSEWQHIDEIAGTETEKNLVAAYAWGWSNPSLSGLLRGNLDAGILRPTSSIGSWQPFDPLELESNPLLEYSKESKLLVFSD